MRILWLKSDLLLPLDKGGRLRTWHLLRHLARRHEITYLAFAGADTPAEHVEGMREVAARVETVPREEVEKGSARFYARVARHLLDPLPYAVGQYRSTPYRRRIQALLASGEYDLVVADFLCSMVNLPARLPCPTVLFTHNVESEIWRRHADTAEGLRKRLYTAQYRRMLRYEGRALARVDGILAVSEADRDTFGRLYAGVDARAVHVVPTGVDTEYFTAAPSPAGGSALVFTGSMDWLPNEDAMVWFCRDVLPRVRHEVPDATLAIVGRAPTAAVSALAHLPGVRVTGRVDDVRPWMREAAVYVVPLRIGGGTRLKIFEAMAMGKAVVSTTVGAEGLPVTPGRDVAIADEADAFAREVVRLLRDPAARRPMEAEARALVAARFDWSAVAGNLDAALTHFTAAHAAGSSSPGIAGTRWTTPGPAARGAAFDGR